MVSIKCPKCRSKHEIVKCANCGAQDNSFLAAFNAATIYVSMGSGGEKGMFCRKCNIGRCMFNCPCGCTIGNSNFRTTDFFFGGVKADTNGEPL